MMQQKNILKHSKGKTVTKGVKNDFEITITSGTFFFIPKQTFLKKGYHTHNKNGGKPKNKTLQLILIGKGYSFFFFSLKKKKVFMNNEV
jgi:hypothetical protein